MNDLHHNHPTLLFVLPVVVENLFTTAVGLIFSHLIGGISGSSLTTISQCNNVITLITAAGTMLVTGSGILCARLLGEGDVRDASRVVEQTLLLSLVASAAVALACFVGASPLMALLMPNAEAAVLAEGAAFFRVLILSLPPLMINNAAVSMLRATGDARSPLAVTAVLNLFQLAFAWIFLRLFPLDVIGAGLSYLLSRLFAAVLAVFILRHSHRYGIRLRHVLRPDFAVFRRILAVGVPTSVESIFAQTGYLLGSTMVIGLGTFEAAVYNVDMTLYTFASLPQNICIAVAIPLVGQLIGAGNLQKARRTGWRIWQVGMLVSLLLSGFLVLFGNRLTPLYSADAAVQGRSARALAAVFFMCIPAISLNTLDPQLRAGGDVRFVMYVTIIAVWAIRLPLTYLFCYRWSMGAEGAIWANTLSLFFRAAVNMTRFIGGKYLHMRV